MNLVAHFIVSLSLVLALGSCPSHVQSGYKIHCQKHFQNVMLVGMACEISKNYTYKCSGGSRGGSRGAKEPPFHQELACKANTLTNLPEAPALACGSF